MNTLTTDQLRHEVKNPGNWESLFHLSAELLRRLDIAEAWAVKVREQSQRQPNPGAREECVFCSRMNSEHHDWCPMKDLA